jgi:hypothetical protein
MKGNKLIGKFVHIIDKDSFHYNEWGIVKSFDGDYYHVAHAGGNDVVLIFDRDQLQIPRDQEKYKKLIKGIAVD